MKGMIIGALAGVAIESFVTTKQAKNVIVDKKAVIAGQVDELVRLTLNNQFDKEVYDRIEKAINEEDVIALNEIINELKFDTYAKTACAEGRC